MDFLVHSRSGVSLNVLLITFRPRGRIDRVVSCMGMTDMSMYSQLRLDSFVECFCPTNTPTPFLKAMIEYGIQRIRRYVREEPQN